MYHTFRQCESQRVCNHGKGGQNIPVSDTRHTMFASIAKDAKSQLCKVSQNVFASVCKRQGVKNAKSLISNVIRVCLRARQGRGGHKFRKPMSHMCHGVFASPAREEGYPPRHRAAAAGASCSCLSSSAHHISRLSRVAATSVWSPSEPTCSRP